MGKKKKAASRLASPRATEEACRRLLAAVREGRVADAVKALSLLPPDAAGPEAGAAAAWALLARALHGYSTGASANSAVADLSLATRYLPAHALVWFHLGLAFLKAGMEKKALWALRKAVELEPGSPRFLYHAAWAALAADSLEAPGWLDRLDASRPGTRFLRAAQQVLLGAGAAATDAGAPHSEPASMIFLRGVACCLQAACGGAAPAQSPDRIAEILARLDFGPGADLFERAARLGPHNGVVRLAAGDLQIQRGDYRAALEHMQAAAQSPLKLAGLAECVSHLHLHESCRGVEDEPDHEAPDRRVTSGPDAKDPDAVRRARQAVLAARASRMAREGKLPEAIVLWKQIEGFGSPEPALLHNLALAYELLGDPEKAATYWRRWNRLRLARRSGPGDAAFEAAAHVRLARSFMAAGLTEDAARAFETALRFAPGDLEAREALAALCEDRERWGEALVHLEYLLKRRPDSSTLLTRTGLARMMNDDVAGATEAWSRAIELEPLNQAAQRYLIQALQDRLAGMSAQEYRRAGLRLIQDVADRLPGQYGPELVLAEYMYSLGERKKGKEAVQRALRLGAGLPEAWLEAFCILDRYGGRRECRLLADRLLEEHADRPEFLAPFGQLLLRRGYFKEASPLFEAAMRHSKNELVPRDIARGYLGAGYGKQACAWAERALARAPNDPEALFIFALGCHVQGDAERAKEAMGKARMLARKSGDRDLLQWIEEFDHPKHLLPILLDLLGR